MTNIMTNIMDGQKKLAKLGAMLQDLNNYALAITQDGDSAFSFYTLRERLDHHDRMADLICQINETWADWGQLVDLGLPFVNPSVRSEALMVSNAERVVDSIGFIVNKLKLPIDITTGSLIISNDEQI